jgi:sortase B
MKSGAMFGSLKGFKGQTYYEQHPFMYLYTEQGNYRIDLIYGCVIGAGQWSSRGFMFSENIGKLVDYAADNTTFKSNLEYREGDSIVALSTCSYEFDNARYVVLGILKSEF